MTTTDPRAANCRAYSLDAAGKVNGVNLVYVEKPNTPYQLTTVELIDEAHAAGNTTAAYDVRNAAGDSIGATVYLAWPFPDLSNKLPPGNPNNQHMIESSYDAAKGVIGPLAMFVGDAAGTPISDVIGGLGLPNNRHVCYRMTWRERSVTPPTPPDPDDGGDYAAVLARIADRLDALAKHLGA